MLLPLVVAVVLAADQLTKAVVRASLPLGQPVPVIPDILWLYHVSNTGGAFSILEGHQWVFRLAATAVVVGVAVYWFVARPRRVQALAMGLLTGGAAGNLIDRLRFGRVTDFLDVRIWPVFNVADICIVVGVCMLGAWVFLAMRDEQREAAAARTGEPGAGRADEAGRDGGPREGCEPEGRDGGPREGS